MLGAFVLSVREENGMYFTMMTAQVRIRVKRWSGSGSRIAAGAERLHFAMEAAKRTAAYFVETSGQKILQFAGGFTKTGETEGCCPGQCSVVLPEQGVRGRCSSSGRALSADRSGAETAILLAELRGGSPLSGCRGETPSAGRGQGPAQ